ncbi:LysM peptidoglycan-binding domain-containing protein [Actinoplanes sp. Pm04-4]|uniref:LysM peptidoglycan-binding domain-containing protein n=1 Tax=Paractinoplanes pyxinae TaxID=2997416 RepID=A0ABT4BBZ4_9ACTN|nr:BTAD domain-containing putative transcriptional regulator [Actinoplanes pyxinae]MCY1144001.1 LysM peptidoglycan-binding domain-containing protein [Actinoplanes pyxinae]
MPTVEQSMPVGRLAGIDMAGKRGLVLERCQQLTGNGGAMRTFHTAIRIGLRTLTVFAAVPGVLLVVAGSPVPERIPTLAQLQSWLDAPFDPRYAAGTARSAAWLCWALIAVTVVLAGAARARRRSWSTIVTRLPTPLQGLAATLIGAAAVTTAATGAAAHAAPVASATDASSPDFAAAAGRTGQPAHRAPQSAGQHRFAAAAQDQYNRVVVRRGDTLSAIAARQLGDADRWPAIFTLNRNRHFPEIGGTLSNPDVIYPGWQLRLPHQPAPPAKSRPDPGSHNRAPAPTPAQRTPASPPSTGGHTPSPASEPASTDAPAPDTSGDGPPPPGGWGTGALAAALTALAAGLWRRRSVRRRRSSSTPAVTRPQPEVPAPPTAPSRSRRNDNDAVPAPQHPGTAAPAKHPATAEGDAPAAPTGPRIADTSHDDPCIGHALAGPGAEAAARAVLVASLTSGAHDDPDAREQVITTSATLTQLLGNHLQRLSSAVRLTVTDDLISALSTVDHILIERRRILQDHGVDDVDALRQSGPGHPPMPAVLLLACTPPENLHARLSNTMLLGAGLRLRTLLVGDWPPGRTTAVDADGATASGNLPLLDVPTALQLLDAIGDARSKEPGADVEPAHKPATHSAADSRTDSQQHDTAAPTVSVIDRPTSTASPAGPQETTAVRIQLLGAPAIYDRSGDTVTGLRFHAREMLVYLAVHRSGANLPDIMEAIWPTATLRRATQRLSTEVADLRRRIRHAGGDTTIQPVVNTGGRYHLDPAVVDIDLWQLHDALRSAKTADATERISLLQLAVDAGAGTLADGFDYPWIGRYREHVRQQAIQARQALAELVAVHDPAGAAGLLRAAAELAPADENTARRALQALAGIGDTRAARELLQQLRQALDDIDETPSAETLALAQHLQLTQDTP